MEEKKDIALSTKMILIGICFVSMFLMGFFTYFTRIDAGYSVNDAFQAAFAVFITLLILGIFAFAFVFGIAELSSYKKQE